MSASVAWRQVAPAGKHHPTAKWSMLMVLLVAVVLGVPNFAAAAPPAVQAPTGPQSGGVFTGPFTFNTYIYCSAGYSYPNSYTSSLDGTNSFAFYGSADGSLLVSINGGGRQLIDSCGDPNTGQAHVATYNVTKGVAPTPTPTPIPTVAPTTPPAPVVTNPPTSGGGNTGGAPATSAPVTSAKPTAPGATPAVAPSPGATTEPTPTPAATSDPDAPAASATPVPVSALGGRPQGPPAPAATDTYVLGAAQVSGVGLLLLLIIALLAWRSQRVRDAAVTALRRAAIRLQPSLYRLRRFYDHHVPAAARAEPRHKGLSPHHHTGKLIAHHHTSYPALAFLLLVSTLLAAGASYSTSATSSELSLTVLGPAPTVAATIDQPTDGDVTTVSTQTVRGSCPLGLVVEIYRNGTFAGSTTCDAGGVYNLLITLVPGPNELIAKDADALSQYGPDSNVVTITYNAPVPTPTPTPVPTATPVVTPAPTATPQAPQSSATPSPQPSSTPAPTPTASPSRPPAAVPAPVSFFIESQVHLIQGGTPNEPISWRFKIKNGQPPYVITWDWGDGRQDVTSNFLADDVLSSHTYSRAGKYQVTARVTDAAGREAVISVLAVVNGPSTGAGAIEKVEPTAGPVPVWPLLGFSGLVLLSFWLGEHHIISIFHQRRLAS